MNNVSRIKAVQFVAVFGLLLSLTPTLAADRTPDVKKGEALVAEKCMGCHDNRQYTRPNRIVHTYEDLRGRVEFCDSASGANFSVNYLDDVVEYLNVTYYKFVK